MTSEPLPEWEKKVEEKKRAETPAVEPKWEVKVQEEKKPATEGL